MRGKRERVLLPPCVPELCGKEFRQNLKKPSPNYPHGHKARKPRIVPAFTVQGNIFLYLSVNKIALPNLNYIQHKNNISCC